jgi:(p)ppGpp synthase/HD superfamily hydrolase
VNSDGVVHPDLGDSIELMRKAHEGQIDKSGRPYYLHPLRVAMRLAHCTAAERHAALLHDVVAGAYLERICAALHELADELAQSIPRGDI